MERTRSSAVNRSARRAAARASKPASRSTAGPDPVGGCMMRTRHAINVYGTNTEQRGQPLGAARSGEVIEAVFTFDCWLGQEHYFVSAAAHTPDGEAFDWLDGVIFFRVSCAVEMEGIANLNARVTTRRVPAGEGGERAGES